jgi:predicted permease
LFERIENAAGALPGVTGVTAAWVPLLAGQNWGSSVKVQGFEPAPDADVNSKLNFIGPDYFRTLGIPLLAGREFTRADSAKAQKVAVVNQQFLRKFHLGSDVIGKHVAVSIDGGFRPGSPVELDTEIIGLAEDSKYSHVRGDIPPVLYRPYRQARELAEISFYIRTSLDPEQMLESLPATIAKIDAGLPVEDVRTLPEQLLEDVTAEHAVSILSALFAVLATVLAAVGLYGVLAYAIVERTKEIGVRIALGAAPAKIHALIFRNVGWMMLIGGTVGLAAAAGVGWLAESLLFNLNGHDPVVLALSVLILLVVVTGAGFIPARRASRIDPLKALRYE